MISNLTLQICGLKEYSFISSYSVRYSYVVSHEIERPGLISIVSLCCRLPTTVCLIATICFALAVCFISLLQSETFSFKMLYKFQVHIDINQCTPQTCCLYSHLFLGFLIMFATIIKICNIFAVFCNILNFLQEILSAGYCFH